MAITQCSVIHFLQLTNHNCIVINWCSKIRTLADRITNSQCPGLIAISRLDNLRDNSLLNYIYNNYIIQFGLEVPHSVTRIVYLSEIQGVRDKGGTKRSEVSIVLEGVHSITST